MGQFQYLVSRKLLRACSIIGTLGFIGLSFQNCGGVKFEATSDPSKALGGPLVLPPGACSLQNITVPIKLLFVVDNSGSNEIYTKNFGATECFPAKEANCTPPTDPNKAFRSGSISAFFNTYKGKANFSWGLESFFASTGHQFINNPDSTNFGNSNAMQTAIQMFNSEKAADSTPYGAAISSAISALQNDPDLNSTSAQAPLYYIVFMSDGYPTDTLNPDKSVNFNALDNDIADLIALAPSRVRLNTLYYGTLNDPNAANTLQHMAQKANGQFLNIDTATTKVIAIDDLIQIPTSSCH